jgi:hypothetical protein
LREALFPTLFSPTKKAGPRFTRPAEPPHFLPLHLIFAFSAQKTHVKPQNHLTHYQPTTSAWRISYTPTAILDI